MFENCNVHTIPCKECDRVIIVQTKFRTYYTAQKWHQNYYKKSCVLANYFHKMDHMFDYDNTSILEFQTHHQKRLFLEIVKINNKDKAINSRSDIDHLSHLIMYYIKINRRLIKFAHPRIHIRSISILTSCFWVRYV